MMRDWVKWTPRLAGGLALLAALACSVMPGGMIPKVAGRCGRELCNCEPEQDTCNLCQTHSTHRTPSKITLTLVVPVISGMDAPGMAFQVVFSGSLALHKMPFATPSECETRVAPERDAFALLDCTGEIVTPPPRA